MQKMLKRSFRGAGWHLWGATRKGGSEQSEQMILSFSLSQGCQTVYTVYSFFLRTVIWLSSPVCSVGGC
jgi:hypothetical protein